MRVVRLALVVVAVLLAGPALADQAGQADQDPHLLRGLELLETGRAEEAVEELELAVARYPEDHRPQYHLGRALLTAGRARDAVPHLERALETAPEPGPVHFLLGQAWLELDELAAARESLEMAAAARPDYPPLVFYRAELCYELGEVDAALERLDRIATAAPRWVVPRARAGVISLEAGRAAEAVDWFREALELAPDNAVLWMRLGSALVQHQRSKEAVEAYRQAARRQPDNLTARITVALELVNTGPPEEALRAIDEVLRLVPDHGVPRYHRASLLARDGEHEEALADLRRALDDLRRRAAAGEAEHAVGNRHPMLARALALEAELLSKLGRREEARATAEELVESEPWFPQGHFLLGNFLLRERNPAGREHLARFKALNDAKERRELGDYYRRIADDPERAAAEYRKALEADPEDPLAMLGLAATRYQRGEPEQALDLLERIRGSGVEAKEWFQLWILTLDSLGRRAEALEAWERAQERDLRLGPEVWRAVHREVGGC